MQCPATFEKLMENVLSNMIWKICLVYLDDIIIDRIIYGKTFEEQLKNLEIVFSRLRRAGLLMSPRKCHFFRF